jgi:hypothetical protein
MSMSPSELSRTVPRDVRLTGAGIALMTVAGAMAIGALASAILMSVVYTRSDAERQLRERDGIAARAEVVQVAMRRGEHPRRVVTYRYDVGGRRYDGRTTLRQSDRREIARSEAIAISYLRSQPDMSWMAGYEPDAFPLGVIPLISISLLAGAAAIARGVRRQWLLLHNGRVAQARIVGQKQIRKDKRKAVRLRYEFRTLSGATQTGRCDVGKTAPPIGATITVVYHRDDPQWSAAYPLQLVRPSRDVTPSL